MKIEERMTMMGHITELRKRVMIILVSFVIGLVGGFWLAKPIYTYLRNIEPARNLPLHGFSPWDGVHIHLKLAFILALAITLPVTMYQLWAFVSPALRLAEQRVALRYVPCVFILFVVGLSFSYFILFPMVFQFTSSLNKHIGLVETYGIPQYFSFMFQILLPVSLLFELPVVIMFLTRIRLLNPLRLRKMRRLAYFILIVLGTLFSPPDLISDMLVSIPLIVLYEIGIFLSLVVYRKQLAEQ